MKLGSNDISSVKIGSTDVNKIYIGSTEVWTSNSGLLADYPGAAAAYSLRLLQTTYTGDAIRVRRASDNAESDIGFVSGQLDTSTLETFCSGTDGFVTTWYDQSGNGYDATQTTAASQPQIVSSGSTLLENGKPTIRMDGVNDWLENTTYSQVGASALSAFVTIQTPSNTSVKAIDFSYISLSGALLLFNQSDLNYSFGSFQGRYDASNNFINGARGGISNSNQNLFTAITDGTNTTGWGNSTQLGQTSITTPYDFATGIYFGKVILNNTYSEMDLQEFVIYHSDQSSNRTGIESNINNHYNIY